MVPVDVLLRQEVEIMKKCLEELAQRFGQESQDRVSTPPMRHAPKGHMRSRPGLANSINYLTNWYS
jgi:hypothetical protein